MNTTVATIARTARESLGRPARRTAQIDWAAANAVKAAAKSLGMSEVWEWVPAGGGSLTRLAEAYTARHAQAYGVIADESAASVARITR